MTRTKRLSVGAIIAVVALFGSAMIGGTAQAKKKKSKSVTVSNKTPRPIPEATLGTVGTDSGPPSTPVLGTVADGVLRTSLKVKKFKGTVGRVAVTYTAATGGGGTDTMQEFAIRISAPDGTTVDLVGGLPGIAIGPLTVQPNSKNGLCVPFSSGSTSFTPAPAVCPDPDAKLLPPFAGVVGDSALTSFAGVKGKGNWTVTALDTRAADPTPVPPATTGEPVQTNILNSVSLKISPPVV